MDRKAARESFVSLPEVLRKQVLLLNAISIAGVLLALLTYIAMGDRIFSLGVAGIAFFGMARGADLTVRYMKDDYVYLQGNCVGADATGHKKRKRYIDLAVGDATVRMPARPGCEVISVGDTVGVYLPKNAPVYERDGIDHIMGYYALDVRKSKE